MNLKDWIHEMQRRRGTEPETIAAAIAEEPKRLRGLFVQGDVADAYLAAYAEWLADQSGIERPEWVRDRSRHPDHPWFASEDRACLLIRSPASFRQRDLFTIPEPLVRPARPKASEAEPG
jgi:hypothetical protein